MPQSLTDIQMVLAPVFAAYGISRAVLFGSVAKGTATEKSDLDLLVDSKLQGLKFCGLYGGRPASGGDACGHF